MTKKQKIDKQKIILVIQTTQLRKPKNTQHEPYQKLGMIVSAQDNGKATHKTSQYTPKERGRRTPVPSF